MDWKQLVADLIKIGIKKSHIAKAIGVTPPTIDDILLVRQKTLRWEIGDKLIGMHRKFFSKKAA